MFKNIIAKKPGTSYLKGLTTSDLGKPDYNLLLKQHENYLDALKKCNVNIEILPESEEFPDSTFVEDTAVLTKEFAVITNPGAQSREKEVLEIEKTLSKYYETFHYIKSPGTLDGGDVLQIESTFYIGLSDRTNNEGANQLKQILKKNGYNCEIVELKETFHLKTGVSYLDNNVIVVAKELISHPSFANYNKIIVTDKEAYAANLIKVNDYVIFPLGYPETKDAIEEAGHEVIEVDTSEFKKHDGGLSCLSLRF